jgi:hypothetical protein
MEWSNASSSKTPKRQTGHRQKHGKLNLFILHYANKQKIILELAQLWSIPCTAQKH